MTPAKPVKEKQFSGWHALACFFGFFALMFAVNGVFLYQAITSFPGEDTPKSYLQGLNYNATLADRAAQTETGWRAEIGMEDKQFLFRLKDEDGNPVGGLRAVVTFRRRATTQADTHFDLRGTDAGEYAIWVERLSSGQWEASVTVYDVDSDHLRFSARKMVDIK